MLSLSEISTVGASLPDDLRAYTAAGFDGIGIWEMKSGGSLLPLRRPASGSGSSRSTRRSERT